jgi:hypothetical protein
MEVVDLLGLPPKIDRALIVRVIDISSRQEDRTP